MSEPVVPTRRKVRVLAAHEREALVSASAKLQQTEQQLSQAEQTASQVPALRSQAKAMQKNRDEVYEGLRLDPALRYDFDTSDDTLYVMAPEGNGKAAE